MPRKTWIAAEKLLVRDDKKAALADYERAEQALKDKTSRLQALRLAKEAEDKVEADAAAELEAAAAKKSKGKGKTKARAKVKARPKSLFWKT
jgi:hypothetical protein